MRKVLLWILSLLLSGCVAHPAGEYQVVTRIDVTVSHNAEITQYQYSQPEQMHVILSYLRRLETYAPVDISADTFRSDAFRIVLHRSDGTQTVYHQIADGYLQKNGGRWVKTDPALASALRRILENLSGSIYKIRCCPKMHETAPYYVSSACRGGVSPPKGRETRPLRPK